MTRFMREKEKTRVIDKDSRAEVRRESFREDQNGAVFSGKIDQMKINCLVSSVCDAYAQIRWLI
jgi:hypothetical protein